MAERPTRQHHPDLPTGIDWRGEFGSTGGREGNTVRKMKPYMRPIILSGMGFILTVIVYVVIHWIWLPPEKPGLETITFIAYTNAPSGKRFALTAVTNHDAYPITFRDIFIPNEASKDFSPKVRIHSTLAGKTLAPGDSCIALFDAPPYTNSWLVVCVATKHMLIQRIFGKYFPEDSFDDIYESQWFPKQ